MRTKLDGLRAEAAEFGATLEEATRAFGTVGESYDNAVAEALNGTFKAELIKLHGPWRTRRQLEIAIRASDAFTTWQRRRAERRSRWRRRR